MSGKKSLFLSGVSWANYAPPPSAGPTQPDAPRQYDSIPLIFNGLDKWPEKTNLLCWSCGRGIAGRPAFMPTHLQESEGRLQSTVRGIFCTFNCVARFIEDTTSGEDMRVRLDMLSYIYSIFNGKYIPRIPPARPRFDMQQYGGVLTEAEYAAELEKLSEGETPAVTLSRPPPPAAPHGRSVWNICKESM